MSSLDELVSKAKAWIGQDPDPETRAELEEIVRQANLTELSNRFDSRLSFGTAGLRGELGAGPNRMNRVLVAQAAAGVAAFLKANYEKPSCVIGFDARRNSNVFAKDSAEILAAAGIKVYLFDDLAATPLIAYAVRELGCSAGIMVTASHNPPADNGYKVYDHTGSQIVSPTDSKIAEQIDLVAKTKKVSELARSTGYESVPASIRAGYLQGISKLITSKVSSDLKIVYSAMHGVGASFIDEVVGIAGINPVNQVIAQQKPDGKFPTVTFPNPEEPGAMDLALATAREQAADLVLVNDPDADRLAVAYRASSGDYVQLTGDELGVLLGEELASRAKAAGKKGSLACSIVSSSMLGKIAEYYGLDFQQTLTGFKWISRVPNLIFGYEEALGYCVDWEKVRDKDGLSAASVVIDIASKLLANGKNLGDQLELLRSRYGYYSTGQVSIRVSDLSIISSIMEKLRTNPPSEIAGTEASFTDLRHATDQLPSTDAVRFDLLDNRRVIVRPSGTEPKLKCYLQAVGSDLETSKQKLAALKTAMENILS